MALRPMFQPKQARWIGAIGATLLSLYPSPTVAQIAGDGTLGTQVNGSLTAPCTGTCIITNGATRGSNLFHSFQQFSLPNGDFAGFVTTPTIQNVLVRVTGVGQPFISNINGTIQTTSPANFFLLNSNGIIFGPGAALNIGGSFLATTADLMVFQDGTEFRTTDPAPLLTITAPIGLGFTGVPQPIQMQGSRLDATNSNFRDFALVGGTIALDDAQVSVIGGDIELTGIGVAGAVGLDLGNNTLRLSVPDRLTRADVALTNAAILVLPNTIGGGIAINTRHLSLSGSTIGTLFLSEQAGDIVLNATETIALSQGSLIATLDPRQAIGNGGNIRIQTGSLSVTGNSGLLTVHSGQGDSGSIIIDARDTVAFDGQSSASIFNASGRGNSGEIRLSTRSLSLTNGSYLNINNNRVGNAGNITIAALNTIFLDGEAGNGNPSNISSSVGFNAVGNGGNIQLTTGSLTATNGASISASTLGQGNGGNITIAARDAVIFDGRSSPRLAGVSNGSGADSIVTNIGSGNGGAIRITAGSLSVTNGGQLTVSTSGLGNAGNISIDARDRVTVDGVSADGFSSSVSSTVRLSGVGNGGALRLVTDVLAVTNGANVSTSTFGQGNGGSIVVNARDRTIVDGFGSNGDFSSIQSGIANDLPLKIVRKGGDLAITTGSLLLNEGFLSASVSSTLGEAGNIDVSANRLQLDNGATIDTVAASGNGGNITLFARDLALLRRNSVISARSGALGTGQGNGGNILINTPFLISAPLENSDIRATAFGGRGGNVTINATGIYWFVTRSRADLERLLGTTDPTQLDSLRLPTNDITAISQGNPDLSGTVTLNLLNLDPSRGLIALPVNLTDPSQQISQSCTPGGKTAASSFVSTGRGGLPLNPDEPLESRAVVTRWVALPEEGGSRGREVWGTHDVDGWEGRRVDESLTTHPPIHPSTPSPLIEAQGMVMGTDGIVALVANRATGDRINVLTASVPCPITQGHER